MSKEEVNGLNEISDQMVDEAIKRDCGVYKYLYHGTSKDNSLAIQSNKEIRSSEVGYLGKGVYCYYLDIEASRLYAKGKHGKEEIAVLDLIADIGNLLFVSKELYQIFNSKALELRDSKLTLNKKIGNYIELFIKEFLKPKIDFDINTIGRYYNYSQNRPVLMVSLRDKIMIQDFVICWEE